MLMVSVLSSSIDAVLTLAYCIHRLGTASQPSIYGVALVCVSTLSYCNLRIPTTIDVLI